MEVSLPLNCRVLISDGSNFMNAVMTKLVADEMKEPFAIHQILRINEIKTQTSSGKRICILTKPAEILRGNLTETIGNPIE